MVRENLVDRFVDFFRDYIKDSKEIYLQKVLNAVKKNQRSIKVDWVDLNAFDSELAEELVENPEEVIYAAEGAVQMLLQEPPFLYENPPRLHVRFYNVGHSKLPCEVDLSDANHLIEVDGIITRVSEVKPFAEKTIFVCKDCGNEMVRLQKPYRNLMKPEKCDVCGSKNIELDVDKSHFINFQSFRLQDPPEVSREVSPSFLDGVVLDDLVDSMVPGDRVRLTGVLRLVPEGRGRLTFRKVFEVNNIEPISKDWDEADITDADIQKFHEEARRPDFKKRVINSIAPTVYGHEIVKEGLLLAMLGGTGSWKFLNDPPLRGSIHVLMIFEDPILGNRLLQFLYKIAPRPVLVKGKTATNLTVRVVSDEITGGKAIEAGAIVLANDGVTLVEEFEKVRDVEYLSTAMKNGEIFLTESANIAISARTTVIAASSPKFGYINPEKRLGEQIALKPDLLSYFDLIYVIFDEPNLKTDAKIADYILSLMETKKAVKEAPYSVKFLRKFIAYARNLEPHMSQEAIEQIKRYYISLRKWYKSEKEWVPISISAKQLYTLVNLSVAHAKLHLRNVVTREDAKAAVDLLDKALKTLGINIDDHDDYMIIWTKEDTLINIIKNLEDESIYGAPKDKVIEKAKKLNLGDEAEIIGLIKNLKMDSKIYEPREGYYRVVL